MSLPRLPLLGCALALQLVTHGVVAGDSGTPILAVQLQPPKDALPEVKQVLAEIEGSNEAFEQAALKDLQKAYDKALAKAQKQIAEVVYSSLRQVHTAGVPAFGFASLAAENVLLETKLVVNPISDPDTANEAAIRNLERSRSKREADMLTKACADMDALTNVVIDRLKAALKREISVAKKRRAKPMKFLQTQSRGLPAQANVRVLPSVGFTRLSDVVADVMRGLDAREKQVQSHVLELQSKLVEAECRIIEETLRKALGTDEA